MVCDSTVEVGPGSDYDYVDPGYGTDGVVVGASECVSDTYLPIWGTGPTTCGNRVVKLGLTVRCPVGLGTSRGLGDSTFRMMVRTRLVPRLV